MPPMPPSRLSTFATSTPWAPEMILGGLGAAGADGRPDGLPELDQRARRQQATGRLTLARESWLPLMRPSFLLRGSIRTSTASAWKRVNFAGVDYLRATPDRSLSFGTSLR